MQSLTARKKALREGFLAHRAALPQSIREVRDEAIFSRIISMPEYREAKVLLCYVSVGEEIDTRRLIGHALACYKTVGVPLCGERPGEMAFYKISGLDQLRSGRFGLLEPDPHVCGLIGEAPEALCILPGLCCDGRGYRLGYGGGYYDRFLARSPCRTVFLVYRDHIIAEIPREKTDVPIDVTVCDVYIQYRCYQTKKAPRMEGL